MFPYDTQVAALVAKPANSIPDVLTTMQSIDALCVEGDGLKWFNWLYLQVTQAVENRVAEGGFTDPTWLAELDIQFAALYFQSLAASIAKQPCPGCWSAMFAVRNQTQLARIQFALAGVNAHINHDLPLAIVATSKIKGTVPSHGTAQYADYTGLNTTLDTLVESAKKTLHVRLLGDPLPSVTTLEDTIAAWDLAAAREKAWNMAQGLWSDSSELRVIHMDVIDGLTEVISKTLLVPVP